jgi:hypothetical protein
MGLREQAGLDLLGILEDRDGGFGWPITVTNPAGASLDLIGFSSDIGLTIDPETGVAISGRTASVALPISRILDAGFALPRAVTDTSSKPWLVRFDDAYGRSHLFKVQSADPDTSIGGGGSGGCITCKLEAYR